MKNRQRFICELNVDGFPYVGCGNSANKKDAQTNAAKDFIQFLVRTQRLNNTDIPDQVLAYTPPTIDASTPVNQGFQQQPHRPLFQGGYGPQDVGQSYRYFNTTLTYYFVF